MTTQWNCILHGRVQAVGMRYMVQEYANEHLLVGIVRNLENGNVEVRAQGDHESLKRFEIWLKSSPGSSSVSFLEKKEVEPEKFENFQIQY